jgi:hypothetical protein
MSTPRRTAAALSLVLALSALPPGRATAAAGPPPAPELSAQEKELLALANDLARRCTEIIERWLASSELSEDRLFAGLYYPVERTDPPKFHTDWDALADRDLQAPEEAALAKNAQLLYTILVDRNGYVPTHNQRYAQPLTGNAALDLNNNRTKRFFLSQVIMSAARSTSPYLVQKYQRDTGELLVNLSVPVNVRGKHLGAVLVGFRQVAQ